VNARVVSLWLLAAACAAPGPRAVVEREDQCGYCRMEVSDARFATQVVTGTGKVVVFDSVECLVGYLGGSDVSTTRAVYVADAADKGRWVPAADAGYLVDATLHSPMGRIVAFASPHAASTAQQRLGGTLASWEAVRRDSAGIAGHGAGGHGAH